MFSNIEMSSLNVCHGCLSFDRKLTPLGKHEELYQGLLFSKPHNTREINFCWECKKNLENIHKFRLKINSAQKVLTSGPLLLCDSLSNLIKVSKVNDYSTIIIEEDKEKAIEVHVEVKHEKEEFDSLKFEINNDVIDNEIGNKEELNEIIKDEVKSENEIDFDVVIDDNDIKNECDEAVIPVDLEKKNIKGKKRQKRGVPLKMKYRTIIMKDITRKDKRKLYDKVKIDNETVMQWMEKKKQQTCKKKFQCELCYCGFSQQKFYDHHIATRHDKRLGRYECDVCAHRFPELRSLSFHVRSHYEQFVCKLCGQAFCARGDIYMHYTHGPHGRVNECRQCGLRFDCRKRNEFFDHYKTMHMQFICDYCGRKYIKKKNLARHICRCHTDHRCKICNKSYSTLDSLLKHNKRKHEVDATEHNYCVECNMQFINNSQYTQHLKFSVKHRANPAIPCPECGKIYTKKCNMTNHYNLVHRKKTKYYCALCDTYYLNGFRLRYHQKYFHEKRPKVKNKICTYCGKGFSANRILANHVRTHTGERPFACSCCTAAFTQKQALTAHIKSAHK